jgi:hypothetical protein
VLGVVGGGLVVVQRLLLVVLNLVVLQLVEDGLFLLCRTKSLLFLLFFVFLFFVFTDRMHFGVDVVLVVLLVPGGTGVVDGLVVQVFSLLSQVGQSVRVGVLRNVALKTNFFNAKSPKKSEGRGRKKKGKKKKGKKKKEEKRRKESGTYGNVDGGGQSNANQQQLHFKIKILPIFFFGKKSQKSKTRGATYVSGPVFSVHVCHELCSGRASTA